MFLFFINILRASSKIGFLETLQTFRLAVCMEAEGLQVLMHLPVRVEVDAQRWDASAGSVHG